MKYLNCANRVLRDILFEIIIIIIDLSGSMEIDDWKPSRKVGAVKANKKLIQVKAQYHPQDQVGIIGFGTKAILIHDLVRLDSGADSLCRVLENTPSMGYTNFNAALKLAESCIFGRSVIHNKSDRKGLSGVFSNLLYGPVKRSSYQIKENSTDSKILKRIVLLSDGGHNKGKSPLPLASRIKRAGVVIDCIGIGAKDAVDEDLLRKIASQNPDGSIRYCFIGDQQELIKKYENLAHHIRPA